MAKTATKTKAKKPAPSKAKTKAKPKKASAVRSGPKTSRASSGPGAADAFVNLLQSPLVADLVAVAATAALAKLAEHGFSGGGAKRTAGKAVKEAGKAAAAAVGRRLGTEVDAIREAANAKKAKKA